MDTMRQDTRASWRGTWAQNIRQPEPACLDARAVIPLLPSIYDEPFADSSQIPTYLIAKLARERVTVALSGDGGDELFGGYMRYFLAARLWGRIERVPNAMRQVAARAILGVPTHVWDKLYLAVSPFIPRSRRWAAPGDRLYKVLRCSVRKTEWRYIADCESLGA